MSELTPKQLHILQHALGCDSHGISKCRRRDEGDGCMGYHRNRYVIDAHVPDGIECQGLVDMGLMEDRGAQEMCAGMHYYRVTAKGEVVMVTESPKAPKLTRSQQRYRSYLKEDSGYLSFGEWLKLRRNAKR